MKTNTKKIGLIVLATTFCLNVNAITNALKVKFINGGTIDETVVRFLPSATTGFDGSYDSYKIIGTSAHATFTNIDAQSHVSINALPSLTMKKEVELFTYVKTSGTYTIQALELGLFDVKAKIELEDKVTGKLYDFKNGSSITVTINANTVTTANRFILHFYPAPITTGIEVNELAAPLRVYIQDGGIVLNVQASSPLNADIYIYNISGQQIYHYSNSQLYSLSENVVLSAPGHYIVNSVINNIPHSQKIAYIK